MPYCSRAAMMRFSTLDPGLWPRCLDAFADLGFDSLDLPMVWREHEAAEGAFDFASPRLAVNTLLDAIAARGMRALVRLGPMCTRDAPGLGVPERILRDRECQARSPRQNPVMVLDPPRLVPLPSVASERYRAESARWVGAACELLRPHFARGTISRIALGHGPESVFKVFDLEPQPDELRVPQSALGQAGESALGFLMQLARAAMDQGFSGDSLLLSVPGSVLLSGLAGALHSTYAVLCTLPPPEAGSESLWREARAIASLSKTAHVDLRVGCHPWETPRRASYTTPAARIAMAAGLSHTTAVMGVSGRGWVGALLDERGAPREHCPRWKELNEFTKNLPVGVELGEEDLACAAPTLDPKDAGLVRALRTHDGTALVVIASGEVALRVSPPPGRWTDSRGDPTAGLTVQAGECATMLCASSEPREDKGASW